MSVFKIGQSQAEGGGDSGSNFALYSFTDAGALKSSVLTINRANGGVSIGSQLVVGNGIQSSNNGADFTGKVWHRGNNVGDWGSLFTAPTYGLLVQAGTGTGDVSF